MNSTLAANVALLINFCYKFVSQFTGTQDLSRVFFATASIIQWSPLGLALGLHYSTLQKIEREKMGRIEECRMEMLAAWLQQKDDVVEIALPTWKTLQAALRRIGENAIADKMLSY